MESPESPPPDQGPTPEGHLLLDKVPAKQLWPTSFVNTKNGKGAASWPAAFVNTHSGVLWPTPGLVGGTVIKQEMTKSPVSPINPSPDASDQEKLLGKGSAETDTTVSESDGTFKVPGSVKIQKRRKKKEEGPESSNPEEANSDSQSDVEMNKKVAPKQLRIPVDTAAKKNLDEFIIRHELDNATALSRASHDLDRGIV